MASGARIRGEVSAVQNMEEDNPSLSSPPINLGEQRYYLRKSILRTVLLPLTSRR